MNAKGNKGDLLLILSGSGIQKCYQSNKTGKKKGLNHFILGFDGGECKKISDKAIQ